VDDGSGNNSGVGGFTDTPYWNSSEFSSDSAWLQDLSNGYQTDNYKDLNWYVRAVRAF
jgi:hypothetical protein